MGKREFFGTDGIRGVANVHPMTPEIALSLGRALAYFLGKVSSRPKVVVGKDTRISGYMLENALTAGLTSGGADVLLVGPMPTPAIAHLTKSFAADAGFVISASHNPAKDNGIKIFNSEGFKLTDAEELEIEELMKKPPKSEPCIGADVGKAKRIDDAKGRYIEFAKASIGNMSFKGIKIALDCANGAAYAIAPDIFRELGAEVVVINNKPDGLNINKGCGALYPEKVRDIVRGHYADIGICLDGDADRIVAVDEKFNVVNGDGLLATIAIFLQSQGQLNQDTLVATTYSNLGLDDALKKHNISVIRTDIGDRYVLEQLRTHDYSFGGEESGHLIFRSHATTGDGIIAALQILKMMKLESKTLSDLTSVFRPFPRAAIATTVPEKVPLESLSKVQEMIAELEKKLPSGRVFVRYSGTENKVRVLIENKTDDDLQEKAQELSNLIVEEIGGN